MSNLKKTHELIRENEQIVKKSQKHEANLQKNSTIYFQVGLIVCLLFVYGLLEMKFKSPIPEDYGDLYFPDKNTEISIENFKVYVEPKEQMPQPKSTKSVVLTKTPEIIPDDVLEPNTLDIITAEQNTTSNVPLGVGDIGVIDDVDDPVEFDFIRVEQVPIYPGCENKKTNQERSKCMSDKITKLVQSKFDTRLGGDLGLTGKQVIRTQFKIDKTGRVIDVKVRAPHPDLENEAKRVIKYIPDMTPGKQRDKNVGVIYSLPIVFKVEN
ncbi:energy transducer TonB [Siansivirga zeaxanthinifaciens]|nr:energy transducer TonB [Siansivirga zeaxanthinifaciens]